ncbi:hypothetical protein ACFLQX_00610 [Bacteroidota bacterium]
MKQNHFGKNLLIFLLGFLSLGALGGGIALIISPDGSAIQMPLELIDNSSFNNYLIPAIILFTVFGMMPIGIIFALIRKPQSKFFNRLNLLSDHHFAWTFAVYMGFGQIIWINIQTLIMNAVGIIHTAYAGLGILIICIALLPNTRKNYLL